MKKIAEGEVIARFDTKGNITPIRWRMIEDGEFITIKVDSFRVGEKSATMPHISVNNMIFHCVSDTNQGRREYILMFALNKARWELWEY